MENHAPIKARVIEFIDAIGTTKSDLCKKTGLSKSTLGTSQLKSELGGDSIARILTKYATINPKWLLLGEGEMMETKTKQTADSPVELEFYKNVHLQDKEQIAMLYEQIGALKQTLSTFEKLMALLIEKIPQTDTKKSADMREQLVNAICELSYQKKQYQDTYTESFSKFIR